MKSIDYNLLSVDIMVDRSMASTVWKPLQWVGLRPIPTARTLNTGIEHLKLQPKATNNRGLTLMVSAVSNPWECRFFWEHQKPRNVCAQAGRSKKKAGQSSSGRLEGRAEERRAQQMIAERRRRIKATKIQDRPKVEKPWKESELYRLLFGENQEEEFTEEELQMIGLGYERTVRFKEPDDPTLKHPLDWYKYGPYSPHARKGIVVGKPVRGRMSDMRVTMFSTVKDAEEQERIDQHDAMVDYENNLRGFDESIGVKHFWVFARAPYKPKPRVPWDEWTLVSQVAVESREDLDKYRLGAMVGKRARNWITQCTAWFRPDLIYVKKPFYQARFEPQEEFFRRLAELIDPLTEEAHRFSVPGEGEMRSYYECLCTILGVEASVSDDDAVSAYEKLDDERRSLCWDFVLSNHPVKLLHPFTQKWRAREQAMTASGGSSEVEDEEESEDGEASAGMEMEAEPDSTDQQAMFWEKEFKNSLRDLEDQEFEDLEMNEEEGTEIGKEDAELKLGALSAIGGTESSREGGSPAESVAPAEDAKGRRNESENARDREFTVRAAVRPFTYRDLLREIVLLRQALVEHRADTREPLKFVDAKC